MKPHPLSLLLAFALSAASAAVAQSPGPGSAVAPDPGSGARAFAGELELAVLAEINLARTDPAGYAAILREYRTLISGRYLVRPGKVRVLLAEGVGAVDEAIAAMERQKPLPALTLSRGLSLAARDHAADQGRTGAVGHGGSDRSDASIRAGRYGSWRRSLGENIAYGGETAREIVIQLLVDDGVPSRGHRANLLSAEFSVAGIAVGKHPVYGTVCVQDFAGGYDEKR